MLGEKAAAQSMSPVPLAIGQAIVPMNSNWRFSAQHIAEATAPGFDDSNFEQVTIPHTNKRLPWHSFDEKSYAFVSVYRRRFRPPPPARGRHVFVGFAGAMTASTVWIHGQRLGEYIRWIHSFLFQPDSSIGSGQRQMSFVLVC